MSPTFLSLNSLANKSPPTNRIRLAAVSNYKLAQLTFAPPDNCTLRRTALIKNLVEIVYKHTPHEHLTKHMARWGYFTPESLEDMTQKDVEKIIYRYSQVVYSTAITFGKEGSKKEQQFLYSDYPEITAETQEMDEMSAYYASLFSSSVFTSDTLFQDEAGSSCSESDVDMQDTDDKTAEKPLQPLSLPIQPKLEFMPTSQSTYSSLHLNGNHDTNTSEKSTSRLSWLSDTGVPTNSAVALNLASELMTLFDMEFNVDLSVPSLHELKKLESSNGSTTSLHKVFNATEYHSSDDEEQEEESEDEDGVVQGQQVVQAHHADRQQLTAKTQRRQELSQGETLSKKKAAFKLMPTLKQLSSKSNKSNSDEGISSASFTIAPVTPTHDQYNTSHVLANTPNYQYCSSSSSSSDSEQEEKEEEEINDNTAAYRFPYNRTGTSVTSITPPNRTSSLDYRAALQDRFRLSDEDSSDASSDYFNDSVDTFQVELNCSRDSAGVDSPSFRGFLNALSSIRKTRSRSSSINEYNLTISSTQTTIKEGFDIDTGSMMYDESKRKNSMQKVVKYLGGHSTSGNKTTIRRGSVASSTLSNSVTSIMMSAGSSLFSELHHTRATATPTSPTPPITLSPRVAKRHGIYTTSIISDTSSFNWAEETRQKDEFGSIYSKASSSKTMPTFFSSNSSSSKQQQGLARSSSTTSLGGFFKRLAGGFNRKDKLQRA